MLDKLLNANLAKFQEKYKDMEILYILPSEIETDLSQEEIAAYKALHTNYPTTVVTTDAIPGAGVEMEYIADTKNYIEKQIQEAIQNSIAGNLLSTNSNQALSAPMGAQLNLRLEALEQKTE